jgi:ubiquinone/menaquinone biosynthesis C-methylase UbiE
MSAFDAVAPAFDRHRAIPDAAAQAIRAAIIGATDCPDPPRLLDLGAGSGRLGWPFVAAGDDYVGLDLSLGMLQAFSRRVQADGLDAVRLVQAEGRNLPFHDDVFDAVMLIHVFGGMRTWRVVLAEARRVLKGSGVLAVGRIVRPADGVDATMKQHLAARLDAAGGRRSRQNSREDAQAWLEAAAHRSTRLATATWNVERTPRGFLERQATGAQFSSLPQVVREEALQAVSAWAQDTFGSLDAVFRETHAFELQVYTFDDEDR